MVSNLRHLAYKASALPTELQGQYWSERWATIPQPARWQRAVLPIELHPQCLVPCEGLEPPRLSAMRSKRIVSAIPSNRANLMAASESIELPFRRS